MKNIVGLVVCGGESSRMGMDKSLIVYHEKPQRYHVYDMLQTICSEVYISCNKKQSPTIKVDYNKIEDFPLYENIGPMAALLSAFKEFPEKDFILIACDYPFIKIEDIKLLIDEINLDQLVACYHNTETNMSEPLLAYYSRDCFQLLLNSFNEKDYSLKNFLKKHNAKQINPISVNRLKSIDTPEAYNEALSQFIDIKKQSI